MAVRDRDPQNMNQKKKEKRRGNNRKMEKKKHNEGRRQELTIVRNKENITIVWKTEGMLILILTNNAVSSKVADNYKGEMS